MSAVRDADLPLSQGCECVKRHSPRTYVPNVHHVVPDSWGGPTVPANLVTICDNSHTATHALIDLYVKLGRMPTLTETVARLGYRPPPLVRHLADLAWQGRPANPTPTS